MCRCIFAAERRDVEKEGKWLFGRGKWDTGEAKL